MHWIPRVSPGYRPPTHFARTVQRLENIARGERERFAMHGPPRHTKTETLLHTPAYILKKRPAFRTLYITYEKELAIEKSIFARDVAERAGVTLSRRTDQVWTTPEGGGFWATSIGGAMIGRGFHWIIIDDPIENVQHAESSTRRRSLKQLLSSVIMSRLEPQGSVTIMMHRWHPDDLVGDPCIKPIADGGWGWPYDRYPAIDDAGRALAPWRYSLRELREIEDRDLHEWMAMYQGDPRLRGGKVFHDATLYSLHELPKAGFFRTFGLDLGYSESTKSDWSVLLRMMWVGAGKEQRAYVEHVLDRQVEAPVFKQLLAGEILPVTHRGVRFYYAGTEKGSLDYFNRETIERVGSGFVTFPSLGITPIVATQSKLIRATFTASAWNSGRVLVPDETLPWMPRFLSTVLGFTGAKGDKDDHVDALVSAYDQGRKGAWGITDMSTVKGDVPRFTSATPTDEAEDAANDLARSSYRR